MSFPIYIQEIEFYIYSFMTSNELMKHRLVNKYFNDLWVERLIQKIKAILRRITITDIMRSTLYIFYDLVERNALNAHRCMDWAIDRHDWVLYHDVLNKHNEFPSDIRLLEASFDGNDKIIQPLIEYIQLRIPSQHPILLKFYGRSIFNGSTLSTYICQLAATLAHRRGHLEFSKFWSALAIYPLKSIDLIGLINKLRPDIYHFILKL